MQDASPTSPPVPYEPLLPPLRDPLFDGVRAELAQRDTPPAVRKELLAAFARRQAAEQAARRWWRRLGPSGWGLVVCGAGGLAAMALVLVVMLRAPVDASGAGPALVQHDGAGAAFVALDSLDRIEQDPAPHLLAALVPRSSLTALGVAVSPDSAGDMIKAEMLVGADGSPLALRLASQ